MLACKCCSYAEGEYTAISKRPCFDTCVISGKSRDLTRANRLTGTCEAIGNSVKIGKKLWQIAY